MRRLIVLGVLVLTVGIVGCGDDDDDDNGNGNGRNGSPTAPTVPAPPSFFRASLQPDGIFTFTGCTFAIPTSCQFQAALVNRGTGCAIRVEGLTRLFDNTTTLQIGFTYRWALPAQQIVRPGERVPYVVNFVPFDVAFRTGSYFTDAVWIDTACN